MRLNQPIDKPQLIHLIAILPVEAHNLPSLRRRKLLAVGRRRSRAHHPSGARRGQQVEVARVAAVLPLAQPRLGPVLVRPEGEFR